MTKINKIFLAFSLAIQPAEKLTAVEWVKKNVVLAHSDKPNADLNYKPHMKEVFEALLSGDYKVVNLECFTGAGKTALMECLIARYANEASVLVNFNDADVAKSFMEGRLQKTLSSSRNTKQMFGLLGRNDITINNIKYPNSFVRVQHASTKNLQSYSARVIINDEVVFWKNKGLIKDSYARTHDRWNSLIFNCSQPLNKNDEFDVECNKGERMKFSWLCECGARNAWSWKDFDYETVWIDEETFTVDWKKTYESISMSCPDCAKKHLDKPTIRRKLADESIYVSEGNAFTPRIITFNAPNISDRNIPWSDSVNERIQAEIALKKGDINPLKQFLQKKLCIPWQDKADEIDINDLIIDEELTLQMVKPRSDKYKTRIATIDVQGGNNQELYFYILIRDWSDNGESRLVYYARLGEDKDEIPKLIKEFNVTSGCVFLDAGYQDKDVLEFASKHQYLTFDAKAMKTWYKHDHIGSQPFSKPVLHTTRNGKAFKYMFIADVFKDILGKLRSGMGMPWLIPHDISKSYKFQILGEQRRKNDKTGVFEWIQVRGDNHGFDCEVAQLFVAKMKGFI